MKFDESKPIFLQIYEYIIDLVLTKAIDSGQPLPSIRQFASEFRVNHITVNKAIQLLVDEGVVEKKRGVGMFLKEDALKNIKNIKTKEFLNDEWPQIVSKIDLLQIDKNQLVKDLTRSNLGESE